MYRSYEKKEHFNLIHLLTLSLSLPSFPFSYPSIYLATNYTSIYVHTPILYTCEILHPRPSCYHLKKILEQGSRKNLSNCLVVILSGSISYSSLGKHAQGHECISSIFRAIDGTMRNKFVASTPDDVTPRRFL